LAKVPIGQELEKQDHKRKHKKVKGQKVEAWPVEVISKGEQGSIRTEEETT